MLRTQQLYKTNEVVIVRVAHYPDEPHTDPAGEFSRAFSLNFVETGSFAVRYKSATAQFVSGAVFVTRPNMEYWTTHDEDYPTDECLSISFTQSGAQAWIADATVQVPYVPPAYRTVWVHKLLCGSVETRDVLGVEVALLQLLTLAQTSISKGSFDPRLGRIYADEVAWVHRQFHKNPAEDYSLVALAKRVGLSPFHLCRVYKLVTGSSIHQSVLSARLRFAAEMLLDGKGVTDTALASGFNHLSHFARMFQRAYGVRPSEFRKTFRTTKGDDDIVAPFKQ